MPPLCLHVQLNNGQVLPEGHKLIDSIITHLRSITRLFQRSYHEKTSVLTVWLPVAAVIMHKYGEAKTELECAMEARIMSHYLSTQKPQAVSFAASLVSNSGCASQCCSGLRFSHAGFC
jgi:hypothetical protein